jgi:hypothetical protein
MFPHSFHINLPDPNTGYRNIISAALLTFALLLVESSILIHKAARAEHYFIEFYLFLQVVLEWD